MADLLPLVFIAVAGLSTVLGAIPLAMVHRLTHRTHDTILGFVAGIMLGVAVFDLLLHVGGGSGGDLWSIFPGLVLGATVIVVLLRTLRRLPLPMPFVRNGNRTAGSAAFMIFVSLAIHNAPEGLATGVGYANGLTAVGNSIALAIAFQNIPEGLLVATAVRGETGSRRAGFGYAALSGLVEPVVGFLAYLTLALTPAALGFVSAFAAGAMLFVVFFQIIPESHRHGYRVGATFALLLGLATSVGVDMIIDMAG